ncbi:penicillin-binding protein, partial [Enterococcus faecium]
IYAKMWKAIFTKFFLIRETKRLFHNLFFYLDG